MWEGIRNDVEELVALVFEHTPLSQLPTALFNVSVILPKNTMNPISKITHESKAQLHYK